MIFMTKMMVTISDSLTWFEHRTKPLFVISALGLYVNSLYQLALEINPTIQLEEYLIGALTNLAIPFGVILLQELLELVTNINESNLRSARRQFEIVILVIVRSFFKKFAKVNHDVSSGVFTDPVQEAVVKVFAIVIMFALIIYFVHLASKPHLQNYAIEGQQINLFKQMAVITLIVLVLYNIFTLGHGFEEIEFINLVFTGMIVIDGLFLMLGMIGDRQFDKLLFESALVISLIFARFPLFSANTMAYILSTLGISFATVALYLLNRNRNLVLLELLAKVPLFKFASPSLRNVLLLVLIPQTYSPDGYVTREGDLGKEIYFVSRGKLEISSNDGKNTHGILESGDYFGDISLLFGEKRTASVKSLTFCEIFILEEIDFNRIKEEYPEFKEVLKKASLNKPGKLMDLVRDGIVL